jgi:hypothetical protein
VFECLQVGVRVSSELSSLDAPFAPVFQLGPQLALRAPIGSGPFGRRDRP